jgi:DNA-binding transcriptional LysR family regulator
MDRFDDMTTFVAVAEAGSFTAAAERLGIAKSAVSRRVSALEQRLGAQLMRRSTRRLSLTDSGSRFYEHSLRLLADLDEVESAVAQQHGELRGRLRVALPLSFGLHHMHKPICEFSRLHPHVDFDLDLNDRRVDLVEEGVDLAIRIGRLRDSSLIARKLFDARTVVIAGTGYLQKHGRPTTPQELRDHAGLIYSNVPEPERWHYTNSDGNRDSVVVGDGMSATSGDFLCKAAAANLGVALQPTFIAHEAIRDGRVVAILEDVGWPVTPGFAVYPPTRHLSFRVRAFIDFLADYFAGTASWDRDCAQAR